MEHSHDVETQKQDRRLDLSFLTETKCPEGDSILSLKNQQPDTITGDFLAHRLIINNVDWAHAELAWHKDMKKQQTQ